MIANNICCILPVSIIFIPFCFFSADTPLGKIPVLEYDGAVLSESLTIARFLAKEFGLAGKDNLAQAQADMTMDAANDFLGGLPFKFLVI